MYETIEIIRDGRVATLALNMPEKLNAISAPVAQEVTAAIKELDADDSVGAIVLTGRGKHFCAGGDIKRMKQLVDTKVYITADGIQICDDMATAIRYCSKPVIAMINGTATGAGCSAAMACDFRIMGTSSKIGMAFVNLGLPGATGGIYLMLKLIGPTMTNKMLMTGDPVGGEEAVAMGLATMCVPDEELESAAYGLAKKLAKKSASAIRLQKKVINKYVFGQEMMDYYVDEQAVMVEASNLPDFTEAVYAFCEKRKPEFNKKA